MSEAIISIKNLHKYFGDNEVLKGIDLEIEQGEVVVIIGPSGSGKTTLVRMLIRSLPKRMRIIAIDDPRLDPHMLLATILRASGVVATSFESILINS